MKQTFKEILGLIFSRAFITGILLMLQVAWILILLFRLSENGTIITACFTVLAAFMALYIVWRDENPAYKMGWLILVCLLPILGTTMYIFFGNKRPSRNMHKRLAEVEVAHKKDVAGDENILSEIQPELRGTVKYLWNQAGFTPHQDTETKYYPLGDYFFQDLLIDLENAKKFIFMEYFIIGEGYMLSRITEILKRKAREGVEVRIIYDDFGCLRVIPNHFREEMEVAGIKLVVFNPIRPILSLIYNNRDHRKITIVDGKIGYTGGVNIADEYINKVVRFGHWKDAAIRMEGSAVQNLSLMFLNMWNGYLKEEEDYYPYLSSSQFLAHSRGKGFVQPYGDSPLDDESTGENVYLEIINKAADYVYIFTPYLIIDNEMQTALTLAAKRGVDVRIVTPAIADKKIVNLLTKSYYRPLIKAGVGIYEYTPGFIHSKNFVSDDRIGVVGTINMDYRSLFLHFECGTLLINTPSVMDMKKDCLETFAISKKIGLDDLKMNFGTLLFTAVLRALSPLM